MPEPSSAARVRSVRSIPAVLVLAIAVAGCQRDRSAPSAASRPVTSAAISRAPAGSAPPEPAALRVPATQVYEVSGLAPGERRPVLVFLHGYGSSGRSMFDGLHLAELGARERTFVIAPDGATDGKGRQFWNAGG